jgi:hypothetical protein
MKRIQKFAAVNVIAALIGTGIPAMAAQNGFERYDRGGVQHQSADRDRDRGRNEDRSRDFREGDRDRRDYDRRDDDRGYQEHRAYGYGYVAPVYQPAPIYSGPVYGNGYYYDRDHAGRTAAIIGGSAAAGALIGAAAGHGQGAVVGAVIGGVAGAITSAATDHHDRY